MSTRPRPPAGASPEMPRKAKEALEGLRAALDVHLAASDRAANAAQRAAIEPARADGDRDTKLRDRLEAIRVQIESAHIAAAAHANVSKDARAALRAERLAGATLHRLVSDLAQHVAALEQTFAAPHVDPGLGHRETLERERKAIERAWNEAEARLDRANRDWSLEVERIRHSVAATQAQTLTRYGQLLELEQRENPLDQLPLPVDPPEPPTPEPAAVIITQPRLATRQPFNEQVQVQIDGDVALLVDLSVKGAQVVSQNSLKPNRAVKMLLPVAETPISCKGQVVWARLEPIAPGLLRYRAGMLFTSPDEPAIESFMTKHSAVAS